MVALFILAVAIMGTLAAIAGNAKLRQTSAESEVLGQILQHKLEEYRSISASTTAIARAIRDGTTAGFVFTMDLDGDGQIDNPNGAGQNEQAAKPSDLMPGATGQVFVLGETAASVAFAGAPSYDFDESGGLGVGVNADAGIPAGWTAGACDIDNYLLVPLRIVITLPTVSGGGVGTREYETFTLLSFR
jgi:hypothetical protein